MIASQLFYTVLLPVLWDKVDTCFATCYFHNHQAYYFIKKDVYFPLMQLSFYRNI